MTTKPIFAFAALAATIILAGCQEEAPAAQERPPLDINVASPEVQSLIEWATFTGRLQAVEDVDILARVSGYLDSVHFEEGQLVEKGDLLFEIDPRPFQAEVNLAKARLAQAEAAKTLSDANKKRAEDLIRSNAISREQLDIRNSEALQAEADVMAAQAELEAAELDLEFTRIKAPITGIAGLYGVTEGNLVRGGEGQATLLTTVVPQDPIYVYFDVDERTYLQGIRRIQSGELPGRADNGHMPVEIQLSDENDFNHKGVINFKDNQLTPGTATMRVRGLLENPDGLLTPGMFARVRTPASKEAERILIPDLAVLTDQELKYVWVVGPDNIVQRRTVEVGPLHGKLRTIRSGLEANERVAVSGIQFLQPGMPVTPRENAGQ
ncbi:efflux RND transporter periplasmic adaptor subunit [Cerasicoccus fimbriatus]|uniref:efflux RND transporter periplasmic adaptor subunit n=1 Tax=Cerasicoccus fimbriatus TaxID=3014554 RepID=UPI0022B55261|nr:efflux RND transporter periplasmic adaptor subunit [Cerasicoccus sp. TK19100]